jgi:soluble lytic murein transglycosylase-like protein
MLPQLATVLARVADLEARLDGLTTPPTPNGGATFAAALGKAEGRPLVAALPTGHGASSPSTKRSDFDDLVQDAAGRSGVDADLIHAVIQAESDYDPTCRSSAGAVGLMQLMPGTASGLGVGNPLDPAANIAGGAKYLRQQLDRFHDVDLALAAYNAGPGAVARYGGVPPYRETQAYVRRVLQFLWQRKGQ